MRKLLKFFFVGLVFLSFAAVTPAQKYIAHVSGPVSSRVGRGWDQPWGGGWGYSWYGHRHRRGGYGSGYSEEPEIGYAHGDSDWVPSVYMDYDKALALGKEQLEQQGQPPASERPLGDIARELRESAHQETAQESVARSSGS
jgi:hypothetical protein